MGYLLPNAQILQAIPWLLLLILRLLLGRNFWKVLNFLEVKELSPP